MILMLNYKGDDWNLFRSDVVDESFYNFFGIYSGPKLVCFYDSFASERLSDLETNVQFKLSSFLSLSISERKSWHYNHFPHQTTPPQQTFKGP